MLSLLGPSELTSPIHPSTGDVTDHRNLYCGFYDGCLDRAVRLGWKSWSCAHCALFLSRYEPQRLAS